MKKRFGLICLMLFISLLASCRTTEVNLIGLAGEIDKFPELNSFPNLGVAYIGSDEAYHYFRIVKPFAPDRMLSVTREEIFIPRPFTLTQWKKQWRWMYGSDREFPLSGYSWLFSVDARHYFIQLSWPPIVLDEAPVPGMLVEAGHKPLGLESTSPLMSTIHPAYHARYDGVDYLLVVGLLPPEDHRVWGVQTHDPQFVTSDGLKVGDTYEKIMEANAPDETEIVSMGQCAILSKSGWFACFEWDTLEKSETLQPGPGSKIEWFEKWRVPIDRLSGEGGTQEQSP